MLPSRIDRYLQYYTIDHPNGDIKIIVTPAEGPLDKVDMNEKF